MVTKIVLYIMLICLFWLPIASQARTINSITIESVGQALSGIKDVYTAKECKKFKPTIKQIKRFFTKAYPTTGYMRSEERYTPCYASGKIEFSDHTSAEWDLYSSGVAQLRFSQENQMLLYNKKNAWYDPTTCTYGMSTDEADDPC